MDELRESSLLFSLEGLLETERERVQREAREAQKRREEELRRVAEAAERRSSQARQEREARERREGREREREQLEHERREALRLATVERARIEAEGSLRLVEVEQARQHDLRLAQIRETERAAHYRALSWLGSAGACSVLVAALAAYFGWMAPAQARAEQHLQSVIRETESRAKATELSLAAETRKNRALHERIEQLETKLAAPSVEATATLKPKPVIDTVRPPHHARRGEGAPCKDSGDPLDNCLR